MVYVVNGIPHAGHKPQGDEYQREPTVFSHDGALDLEATELHLYICAACPWAHRTLITRNLSQTLRFKVTVSVVSPFRDDAVGWEFLHDGNHEVLEQFSLGALPVTADASPLKATKLLDVYLASTPAYTGNITTPILYDARSNTILSNDSFGIMRTFVQSVPQELGQLYSNPEATDQESRQIDAELGRRVYMCGLAKTQEAYEASSARVFAELDRLERLLASQPRLVEALNLSKPDDPTGCIRHARRSGADERSHSNQLSLADIQLVACLVRFDAVYFSLFKCFKRRIASYPCLAAYLILVTDEIGSAALALDMPQIVHHYWSNFTSANPNGVVPTQAYQQHFLEGGIDKYRDATAATAAITTAVAEDESRENMRGSSAEQDQSNAAERRARGEFVRGVSAHRNWLGDEDFPMEPNRYVLFVANNCPWCHRVMMARALYPGMEQLIGASVMFYRRGGENLGEVAKNRWRFLPDDQSELKSFELERPELLDGIDKEDPTGNGIKIAPEIYQLSAPESTEASVPILFDKKTLRVVSNESADIVRMFAMQSGFFDESLLERTDAVNARVYQDVNNGAYRAGFSSSQKTHEDAVRKYFAAFDWLNNLLSASKYLLTNDAPTEADLRLFPTVYRHDPVYFSRMKLNVAMVRDYPNLNRWLQLMKGHPAVQRGSRIDHCLAGYFGRTGNGLVPFVGLEHDGVHPY